MPRAHQEPRERLLERAIGYVRDNGISDLRLRELAAAIGTSHRMLIYHFGSKAGLMVAIVEAVEEAQRAFFAGFSADSSAEPMEIARAFWRRVSDPALAANVRLFFELYGQALQGRPGTEGFLDDIVDAWVGPQVVFAVRLGTPEPVARADARLGVAIIRGLLLDLVATGRRDEVDAAFERYLALYAATGTPAPDSTRRLRPRVSRPR